MATLQLLDGLLLEGRREFEAAAACLSAAAEGWDLLGIPYERGQTLLAQGRCLAHAGAGVEASRALDRARSIFRSLGARPALAESEALAGSLV